MSKRTVTVWWNPKFGQYSEEILKIVNLHERGYYLEVSVGKGRYTLSIAESGRTLVGVDLSREILKMCSTNLEHREMRNRVALVQADAANLPLQG